jgi:signal transduction histidine kinase
MTEDSKKLAVAEGRILGVADSGEAGAVGRRHLLRMLEWGWAVSCLSGWVILGREFLRGEHAGKVWILGIALAAHLFWGWWGMGPVRAWMVAPVFQRSEMPWPIVPRLGSRMFLGGELLLSALCIWLALPSRYAWIVRLLLLPGLLHAVIHLSRGGALVFTGLTLAVYAGFFGLGSVRGWGFFCECAFTLLLSVLWVSTEKSRSDAELAAVRLDAANRELGRMAVQAQELALAQERNHMAREIHDLLGHSLTVIGVQLEVAMGATGAEAREAVAKAKICASQGLREVRDSVRTLRGGVLYARSLSEGLEDLVVEHRQGGQNAGFQVAGVERELPAGVKLALYRAAQEGLTNVRKHAPGSRAWVELDYQAPDAVRLVVRDEGPGGESVDAGFGLQGLRERAEILGGTLVVQGGLEEGFSITLTVPA